MLLGILVGALVVAALLGVRKCDLTPPCPPGQFCTAVKIIGRCPIDALDGLASVAAGGTVAVWTYLRRRDHG
ncbi:MAG: hypothetical protein KGK07_14150 [Chloroflexota bacterium]|nr:hypothetical protein [Chloroflexota bacterium]